METEYSTECLLRDQIFYMSESGSSEYCLLWKQIDEKSWLPWEKKIQYIPVVAMDSIWPELFLLTQSGEHTNCNYHQDKKLYSQLLIDT